jgi:hypothetical protein
MRGGGVSSSRILVCRESSRERERERERVKEHRFYIGVILCSYILVSKVILCSYILVSNVQYEILMNVYGRMPPPYLPP